MSRTTRISARFAVLQDQSRKAFVPYLTAGDPDLATTGALCRMLAEEGADIIELGVPFTDPIADGPTNQRAAQRALDRGIRPDGILELVRALRSEGFALPIVLFTYWNPLRMLLQLGGGYDALAGIDGILVTDLPPEHGEEHRAACAAANIDTIFLAAPTTPAERLPGIAAATSGFLYYVSSKGVTGARAELAAGLEADVGAVKAAAGALPVCVGFGIGTKDVAARVCEVADGFVVGSALGNVIEKTAEVGGDVVEAARDFVRRLDPR
ncbi:MAG: tryptophan synthase subunit alpha [Deltaproteobacteria bacterium]|nr:tryptophan synthase subunit alpha [Deltaproteobacteria bacterium]